MDPEAVSVWISSERNLVLYIPKKDHYGYAHYYGGSDSDDAPAKLEYEAFPMPECPPNMSHMAYARLLFDKACHVRRLLQTACLQLLINFLGVRCSDQEEPPQQSV